MEEGRIVRTPLPLLISSTLRVSSFWSSGMEMETHCREDPPLVGKETLGPAAPSILTVREMVSWEVPLEWSKTQTVWDPADSGTDDTFSRPTSGATDRVMDKERE